MYSIYYYSMRAQPITLGVTVLTSTQSYVARGVFEMKEVFDPFFWQNPDRTPE